MITELNTLIDHIEEQLSEELNLGQLATQLGTTEYHLRRMFSALAGMPLSEYVRRRRMTRAATALIADVPLLEVAVTVGYGSAEAFTRAFRAVHQTSPADVRKHGGPLRPQAILRFRLTVEGTTTMHTNIDTRPAFVLAGHAARVPLTHHGVNPHIQAHVSAIPAAEHERLKALGNTEPGGLLQVSLDVDPDYAEGTELTYLHGVAVASGTAVPSELDVFEIDAGTWVIFKSSGSYPAVLQETYAASAAEWFPAHPWRLRPGPSIVAVLDRADDFSTATTQLWLPIEPA